MNPGGSFVQAGLLIVLSFSIELSSCMLKDIFTWTSFDLKFPNESLRQSLIESKQFKPDLIFPEEFVVWRDKLFFMIDRSRDLPVTLAYVSLNDSSETNSPKLTPYPDWEANLNSSDESAIHSVKSMFVDACDRLWLVDNGTPFQRSKAPRIVVFDLQTDELIRALDINLLDNWVQRSFFVDVTEDTCDKAFAYITYPSFQTTVYDFESDKSWEVELRFDPASNEITSGSTGSENERFAKLDYVIPLSPEADGSRALFYESHFNEAEFITSSKVLRTEPGSSARHRTTQVGSLGMFQPVIDEKTGIIFYQTKEKIGCWNSVKHANETSPRTTGLFATNETELSLRRMRPDGNGNLLLLFGLKRLRWECFSSRTKHLHPLPVGCRSDTSNLINHKISAVPIAEVVKGTVCDAAHNEQNWYFGVN